MAATRIVEEERGTYAGQIRPQHNGYWAGDFSTGTTTRSGTPTIYAAATRHGTARPTASTWR